MSDLPLSKKVGLDVTDFKTGIAEMNRGLRVIESGFRATAAEMGNWGNSADGLEARMKALNGEIGLQQKKVDILRAEYQRVAAEKGANSRAAQDLQIKLNKETETLGKMKTELKDTSSKLETMGSETGKTGKKVDELEKEEKDTTKATKDLGKEEDSASKKTEALGRALGGLKTAAKAGALALAGIATAALGVVAGLGALAVSSASFSDVATGFEATAARVGQASDSMLASLHEAAGGTISDFELMQRANFALTGAGEEFGTQFGEALPRLLEIARASARATGQDVNFLYESLVTGIKRSSPMILDNLGIQIKLGEANEEYAASLGKSVDEMTAEEKQVALLNAVMEASEGILEGVDLETQTNTERMAALKAEVKNLADTIGSALQPMLTGVLSSAGGYLTRLTDLVRSAFGGGGNFSELADGIGEIFGDIVNNIADKAPEVMDAVLGILQGIVEALVTNIPVILPAVIQIITSLVQFLVQMAPMLIQGAVTIITTLAKGFVQMAPMLIQGAVTIIATLARGLVQMLPTIITAGMQLLISLIQGITQALPILISTIVEIIPLVVTSLIENLPLLIDAAIEMVLAIVNGLVESLPILIGYIPTIIISVLDALMGALPTLIEAGVQIILTLISALTEAIPTLIEYIPEILVSIVGALIAALPLIGEAAIEIILALIDGIGTMLPRIGEAAGDIITTVVESIGNLVAKVMEVGENIVRGVWEGIQRKAAWFRNQISQFFSNIIDGVKNFLGIESPSTVFAGIGTNMALGLGKGFGQAFSGIEEEIDKSIRGMPALNLATSGAQAAGGNPVSVMVNANVASNLDMHVLARLIRNEMARM